MLAATYRFHSRGGVKYVYRTGVSVRSARATLLYAVNTHKKQRFAVVVSKKVAKSAVLRNRMRRRVFEALRLELLSLPKERDYVIILHTKEFLWLDFSQLRAHLSELFSEVL